MTGPINPRKFPPEIGLADVFIGTTFCDCNMPNISDKNSSLFDSGRYNLEAAEHFWPWNSKVPLIVESTACDIFALG